MKTQFVLAIALLLSGSLLNAQDLKPAATHDAFAWKWEKAPSWLDYAAKLDATRHKVTFDPGNGDPTHGTFRLLQVPDSKQLAQWNGHKQTCFLVEGDRLFYV